MGDAFRKVSPGQRLSISAGAYNAFVDAARYARDRQADLGGRPSAFDFALQQMVVKSTRFPDHLECRRLTHSGRDSNDNDKYAEGEFNVYVLKPWALRCTPFDGKTINGMIYRYNGNMIRTVWNADGNGSEVQIITPNYEINCIIYAAMADIRGQLDPEDVSSPYRTVLVDVNVDGRAWATTGDKEIFGDGRL
ncbi:MAG: hypothetical protein LBT97_03755 [Planctomycetota bacterium]|jgi:hypothetical protein|nr:hypothetical protein [Planctomycetota bacterium]